MAGNLSVSGAAVGAISMNTSALSEVKGNISVTGGWAGGSLILNSFVKADKNVTANLGNFNSIVTIGETGAATAIGGNLSVKSGAGNDSVTLTRVAVAGTTTINTGAGADKLFIETGSTFAKAFSADLGAGDDLISLAQDTGSAAPVLFNAKTTITAGAGNDTLLLGRLAGDTNSKAVFAPGSVIDAGSGFNTFDDELGLFSNTVNLLNWTDPTP